MKIQSVILLLYAILTIFGGMMGYVKADSMPSLVMGLLFGTLIFISAFGVHFEKAWGLYMAAVLAGVLLIFFGYRFISFMRFMPAGLMSIASIIVLGTLYYKRK